MRFIYLILLAIICLASCMPGNVKDENVNDLSSIRFITTPVQSPSLLVRPELEASANDARMKLTITFGNLAGQKITIREILLSNSNGLNSSVDNGSPEKLVVPERGDTTLSMTFRHINDKKFYHATGLPGLIDSVYNLSVYYTIDGMEGLRVVNLVSRMPDKIFSLYQEVYQMPVQVYGLNPSSEFEEKQRQFLLSSGVAGVSPFVHITEQEMAVSGLNFRVKCFHMKDTLHTEVFIVNHSEMTVKIDSSVLALAAVGNVQDTSAQKLSIEKVTGSKDLVDMLGKGDRAIINITRRMNEAPEKLLLALTGSFFLANGKPLFHDNIRLSRVNHDDLLTMQNE